ncbi:transcriptional regulator [Sphaerochaeta pleomorpha str. Grapes]|uniref:Transcriptional regulator n=1 Tax=Sphaerochaeta pleomorpha (strain ATCC BAA-1885 / DSM 22778 / Grapes) TaxID=158190 RepID=G8QXL7_SPHPG|nr:MarR family transcriptional regulator [Sphaerochaeta pleomorpha]AEV29580.1 transcriptional regulator [Sphaerochaeta pleomorpha str. Grapes]
MEEMERKAFVFGSLFALSNRLQVIGDKFDDKITVKQWLLLALLMHSGKDSLSLGELAALGGSSHQNTKKMASLLEKLGFLKMEKSSEDARVLQVSVTSDCLEYLKGREEREVAFLERLFQGFSSETLQGLCEGFSLLARNIEQMEKKHV